MNILLLIYHCIPGIFAIIHQWEANGYKMRVVNGSLTSVKNIANLTNHLVIAARFTAIYQKAFINVGNLESLSIETENTLEILPPLVFLPLKNLSALSLANNRKISSTKNAFIGLNKLRSLDVTGILHKDSHKDNFNGLPESLCVASDSDKLDVPKDSAQNAIQPYRLLCMKQGIVKSLKQVDDIEKLRISVRKCATVDLIDNYQFSIGMCDLRKRGIIDFKKNWYRFNDSIPHLNLEGNNIENVSSNMLNDLPPTTVRITLHGNKLKILKIGTINNTNLKSLDLSYNFIEEIEDHALENTRLISLILSYNHLTNNKFVATVTPSRLIGLYLDHNNINKLFSNAFVSMTKLRMLNLSRNKLETLEKNAFNGLQMLEYFYIGGNNFTTITADSFYGLSATLATKLYENRTNIEIPHYLSPSIKK